ncbi:hypothetical protein Pmani_012080 [Petrolisthes manimaculis]|uniref:Uncharacterized protein n=1 Tax=Petrolisthes manimaculis TaxID=1843537 RepID=A0AAE1Q1M5_9EUCA|nr:hypothetical protein Pmani_012080 [Petrolisthes manimaculis]
MKGITSWGKCCRCWARRARQHRHQRSGRHWEVAPMCFWERQAGGVGRGKQQPQPSRLPGSLATTTNLNRH